MSRVVSIGDVFFVWLPLQPLSERGGSGSEIHTIPKDSHEKKIRPCLVIATPFDTQIRRSQRDMVIIAPMSTKVEKFIDPDSNAWLVYIDESLKIAKGKSSVIILDQVRALDLRRLNQANYIGSLNALQIFSVKNKLKGIFIG